MNSIVIDLQRDATDSKIRVSDLLRKALVVARKLKLEEFGTWISHELEGYPADVELPEYRKVRGVCRVYNPYNGRSMPVQFSDIPTEVAHSHRHLGGTIAELEGSIATPMRMYSVTYAPTVARRLMDGMRDVMGSHLPLPAPTLMVTKEELVGIVDAVRNAVLKWALKLEEDGILGEGFVFTTEERKVAERAHYTLNFNAPVTNSQIQQASPGASQSRRRSRRS